MFFQEVVCYHSDWGVTSRILCSCVNLGEKEWKMLKKTANSRVNFFSIITNIYIPRFGASRGGPLPPKKFGNPGERLRKKKWDLNELPKFEKNFYVEHPEVARLTPVSFQVLSVPFCIQQKMSQVEKLVLGSLGQCVKELSLY